MYTCDASIKGFDWPDDSRLRDFMLQMWKLYIDVLFLRQYDDNMMTI